MPVFVLICVGGSYRDVVGTNTSDDSNKTLVDVSIATEGWSTNICFKQCLHVCKAQIAYIIDYFIVGVCLLVAE